MKPVKMTVWSRYILTTEQSPSYDVHASDDSYAATEVVLADIRVRMWPHNGSYSGLAERSDTLSRGLVETCTRPTAIQCDAYPEGL